MRAYEQSPANANAPLVDDPQLVRGSLNIGEPDTGQNQIQQRIKCLLGGPQHPYAAMTARWVLANIGEVEIERDEDPVFGNAGRKQTRIDRTCKVFREGRFDVVALGAKGGLDSLWEVLVQLEPKSHRAAQAGNGTIRSRAKSAA